MVRTAGCQRSLGTGLLVQLRMDYSIGAGYSSGGLGPLLPSLSLNSGRGFCFGVRWLMRSTSRPDWC